MASAANASSQPARHGLRRLPAEGLVSGVCAGIAASAGVDPVAVRIAFLLMTLVGGFGIAVYLLMWVITPADASTGAPGQRGRALVGSLRAALAASAFAFGILVVLRHIGLWPGDRVAGPAILALGGLALVWRQTPAGVGGAPGQHARLRRAGRVGAFILGPLLIAAAVLTLLHAMGTVHDEAHAFIGGTVLFVALTLVFGPWCLRLVRSLADERAHRIREQERAEVAAHLHDSVLQTLALIQKRATDPREVSALARRQERELRHWLFEPNARDVETSLAAALTRAAEEIEELHGVPIEVVTVGDAPLDGRLGALVKAAREAMSNAARFAGAERVDLYAECGDDRVEAFVRDRGAGFELDAVPADRRGVRECIVARMQRHGGRATINSVPGAGTEVELVVELA